MGVPAAGDIGYLLYVAATRATNRLTIQAEFLGDIAEHAGVFAQ